MRKRILRFFTTEIDSRSLGWWCVKIHFQNGFFVSFDAPLICLVNKRKVRFRILSDLKIQSWIFLKKRTRKIAVNLTDKTKERPLLFWPFSPCIFLVLKQCRGNISNSENCDWSASELPMLSGWIAWRDTVTITTLCTYLNVTCTHTHTLNLYRTNSR